MARKKRMTKSWTPCHIDEKYIAKAFKELKKNYDNIVNRSLHKVVVLGEPKSYSWRDITAEERRNHINDWNRINWKLKIFYEEYPEYVI